MNTIPTDWTPGAIALGVAATVGVFFALRVLRKGRPAGQVAEPSRAGELTRQRDALYEQIRALDADPSWRPEDRALNRHRLVIEAATTLKAMDQAAVAPVVEPRAAGPARSPWVSAVIGGAAGVFGAGLVMGIQSYTTDKPAEAMGSGMGSNEARTQDGPSQAQLAQAAAAVAAAKAAVDAAPDDIQARLEYSRALMDSGDVKGAYDQTQAVITKHPDDPDARTLQAVMLLQIGDVKMAAGLLDKVLSAHPEHVEALSYRGAIYMNDGDPEKAVAAWERVITLDPMQQKNLAPLIEMAKQGKNPFARGPSSGAPPADSAASGGMSSGGSSAPSALDITGTISSASPAPFLFVYLRPAGQDRGPPAAVKRFQNPSFPLEFRLGAGDSPMGGAFPEDGTLSVRIDLDGNPTTREEGAAETKVEHVHPGQTGVVIGL